MKKLMVAVPLCLLLLAGCEGEPSGEVSPPVSPPATTAVSDSPTPGAEPTQPAEPTAPAEPVSYPGASYRPPREYSEAYEEYFSVLRPYEASMVTGLSELEDRYIQYDAPTVYVVTRDGQRQAIAEVEEFHHLVVDEEWIYATEKDTTLFRMDWQGENREDLLTDPELVGSIRKGLVNTVLHGEVEDYDAYLADGQVLFFMCGSDEASTLCRLFIPDGTLDVLLVALPSRSLDWPRSNHEVGWFSDNPSFEARYAAIKDDPDISAHDQLLREDRAAVELIYHTSNTMYHYFNTMTGEYYCTLYDGWYYRHPNQPSWMPVIEY